MFLPAGALKRLGGAESSKLVLFLGFAQRRLNSVAVSFLPFSIRRLWLLVRGAMVDRDNPRFEYLGSIEDPERFV